MSTDRRTFLKTLASSLAATFFGSVKEANAAIKLEPKLKRWGFVFAVNGGPAVAIFEAKAPEMPHAVGIVYLTEDSPPPKLPGIDLDEPVPWCPDLAKLEKHTWPKPKPKQARVGVQTYRAPIMLPVPQALVDNGWPVDDQGYPTQYPYLPA